MDAYQSRKAMRDALERAEAESRRLRVRLAMVGQRERDDSPYAPPDARVPCGLLTDSGPCPNPSPLGERCAAHLAGEVL
ncbi:hypothetical protein DRW03_21355 [Corallococcus sp. H22C18031201]|nr:hypothetical protein DRW03_21355 [Corallococcus sp. H22C18031201]